MNSTLLCKKKRLLLIITGIAASGKSTLAEKLGKKYNFSVLSFDSYKIKVYEQYGFLNETERLLMRDLAICRFKATIIELARYSKPIIVEYPFDSSWQEFFDFISQQYNYNNIVINCNTRDFNEIWNSRVTRDSDFTTREKCLTASVYVKDKLYKSNDKLNAAYKEIKRKEYESGKYTSLQGHCVFTDKEFSALVL